MSAWWVLAIGGVTAWIVVMCLALAMCVVARRADDGITEGVRGAGARDGAEVLALNRNSWGVR